MDSKYKLQSLRQTGVASVSQADGWAFKNDSTTRVDSAPEGFRGEYIRDGNDSIFCAKCDNKVW